MDKGKNEDYLKGISNQVDILIRDGLNLKQFLEQASMFVKMCNAYSNALEQQKKNAVKNPKLRNKSKRPAGPECFWDDLYSLGCDDPKLSKGYWRLPDERLPRCPYFWALPEPFGDVVPPAKNRDEELTFHYAFLTIIHDNVLPQPPYVIISEGIWNKCDAVPRQWWDTIETVEDYDLDHLKAKIDRALKEVKKDLPVKVDLAKREAAEAGQGIKPAKESSKEAEQAYILYHGTGKTQAEVVVRNRITMKVQEIIDLMQQNADSLDRLSNYPLNDKLLFNDESFSDSDVYYQIYYHTHFVRYDELLTWLDYNKPGLVNTLERENSRVTDSAKALDKNYQEIKWVFSKQLPNIVKAYDPSLKPREIRKGIKDDHSFRIALFKTGVSIFAEKFRYIAKLLKEDLATEKSIETEQKTEENIFHNDGDKWTVVFNHSKPCYIDDIKGMGQIAQLLAKSPKSISVVELANPKSDTKLMTQGKVLENNAVSSNSGKLQKIIDEDTISSCQKQLVNIASELADAEKNNDLAVQERLREEKEKILSYIQSATKPSGQSGSFNDDVERARKAVSISIKRTLDNIKKHNPTLYQHFDNSIQRGTDFVYKPDREINWEL